MAEVPTGTVTFLFTDIEGSTTRWEHETQAMSAALACHDTLMRQAIEASGCVVLKTIGDAFNSTLSYALNGFQAALTAQHALQVEAWGEDTGPLCVRMALHSGTPEARDDSFGPTLSRVARLLNGGHGGQVLLSQAATELVRDRLPADEEHGYGRYTALGDPTSDQARYCPRPCDRPGGGTTVRSALLQRGESRVPHREYGTLDTCA